MIDNLKSQFLYDLLPSGLLGEDIKGLIEAVTSGYQDRLGDIRSYSNKLNSFWTPGALPDGTYNAVLVDLTSDAGKTYTQSLDIHDDTPAEGSNQLPVWVAQQLGVDVSTLANVRYGYDSLRAVSADTLSALAATLGAILYQTNMMTSASSVATARTELVNTWFPRLKIKGTAQSFDVLGRILGFDDVRVTPLWTRLSPRDPSDIGSSLNDADFAASPEYFPQQVINAFYNPFAYRDGPFYSWSGTAANGTASTMFYTESITGTNPWVEVILLGSLAGTNIPSIVNGTVTHPASGSYALAGGSPYNPALVDCPGSSIRFQALAPGDAFNGLSVNVSSSGTLAVVSISDRLSAIKYRSSYFDLGLSASMDKVEALFSSRAVTTNKDLQADPEFTSDGTAVSPYRPWVGGSIAVARSNFDWLTSTGTLPTGTVISRLEADPASTRQLDIAALTVAGVQVTQSFEEVRAATRIPRRSQTGFLLDDSVGYAPYVNTGTLFIANSGTYTGSYALSPLPYYVASILAGTIQLEQEIDPINPSRYLYSTPVSSPFSVSGAYYDFSTGTYYFNVVGATGVPFIANWTVTTTEVIRPEPSALVKSSGVESTPQADWEFTYLARPEDQDDSTLVEEAVDDYPWRREVVIGGELVDLTFYVTGTELGIQPVSTSTAFVDHTGVDYDVFGVTSQNSIYPLLLQQARSYDASTYLPGGLAVGYRGTLKSLSEVTPEENAIIRLPVGNVGDTETDYDVMFEPGYELYLTGLAQGVLVADMRKFFGQHHSNSLTCWFPFNEHVDADLSPVDHSVLASNLSTSGVAFSDRQWDAERGWSLHLRDGAQMQSAAYRGITTELATSFWINVTVGSSTEVPVVDANQVKFTLNGTVLTGYALNDATTPVPISIGSAALSLGWNFAYISSDGSTATFGIGTLASAGTSYSTSASFAEGNPDTDGGPTVTASAGAAFAIHDLRVWNVSKNAAELDLVRYHAPTKLTALYPLGFFYTLDRQDKHGIGVLPSGWAYPAPLAASYRRSTQALIQRYDSMGVYTGEARFKEVGIGGEHPLPPAYTLGQQFIAMTASGVAPFSTSQGQLPGWNKLWQATNYAGYYDVLNGSTSSGSIVTSVYGGTASPWPNNMDQTNPFRQFVFVQDVSGSRAYQVSLDGNSGSTWLSAVPAVLGRSAFEISVYPDYIGSMPTGAYTLLTGPGCILAAANGTGTSAAYSGTIQTPPLYMYTESRVVGQFPGATVWTGGNFTTTPADNGVNPAAMPSIVTVNAYGTWLNTPVLGTAGVLEFSTSSGTLPAGPYRLTVFSGQIGQPDKDFTGFDVVINVNETLIDARLLSGMSGYNFSGEDTFEFQLEAGITGNFLTSFTWTNPALDTTKGTQRQLAIYGFSLRRIHVDLYKVTLTGAGTLPSIAPLAVDSFTSGTTPGGWYGAINSWGSLVAYTHESTIYTHNDTVTSNYPLGDTLTALTNERMDDIIYTGTL